MYTAKRIINSTRIGEEGTEFVDTTYGTIVAYAGSQHKTAAAVLVRLASDRGMKYRDAADRCGSAIRQCDVVSIKTVSM